MSNTLPGADVRGFYAALGIELPKAAGVRGSIVDLAGPGRMAMT